MLRDLQIVRYQCHIYVTQIQPDNRHRKLQAKEVD